MARNPVQFQKGISLNAFLSLYGTEDQCFDALYQWRWPNGFLCPHVSLRLSGDGWRFQRLRVRFQSRLSGRSQMSFLGSARFVCLS